MRFRRCGKGRPTIATRLKAGSSSSDYDDATGGRKNPEAVRTLQLDDDSERIEKYRTKPLSVVAVQQASTDHPPVDIAAAVSDHVVMETFGSRRSDVEITGAPQRLDPYDVPTTFKDFEEKERAKTSGPGLGNLERSLRMHAHGETSRTVSETSMSPGTQLLLCVLYFMYVLLLLIL